MPSPGAGTDGPALGLGAREGRGTLTAAMRRGRTLTQRLELRPYTGADFRAWRAAYLGLRPPQDRWDQGPFPPAQCTRAIFDAMRARHRSMAAADTTYVYGVFRRRGGALLGVVDLHVLCRDDRQLANLGYKIHNHHRRRGYGAEAARAALEIGFRELGLNRIEACIDPDNRASLALARGLGMRGGDLCPGYLFEDGAWVDQVVFEAGPPDLGLERTPPRGG